MRDARGIAICKTGRGGTSGYILMGFLLLMNLRYKIRNSSSTKTYRYRFKGIRYIPALMTSYWTFFPKAFCRRCFIRFIARWVMSMPIHRRFSFWAAEIVVPQPRKSFSTTPPSGHEQRMIVPKAQLASGSGTRNIHRPISRTSPYSLVLISSLVYSQRCRSPVRMRTDPSGSVRPARYFRRAACFNF